MENDEPDSFEPPKLEDSTAPVSSTPKATQSLQATSSILVPKAVSFDSFVDQKATSLRKKSMPASMLSSSADGFEVTFDYETCILSCFVLERLVQQRYTFAYSSSSATPITDHFTSCCL